MFRRTWIVWLMLALLPLRGWAAAAMPMPMEAPAREASMVVTAVDEAVPPCHEQASEPTHPTGAGCERNCLHNCLLCQLCHGSVAGLPAFAFEPLRVPSEGPLIAVARDTGRWLAGGLERPPRIPRS